MKNKFKKITDKSGETLVETLVALAIVILTVSFLVANTGAVNRMNSDFKDYNIKLEYRDDIEPTETEINMGGMVDENPVAEKYVSNGYVYYDTQH